MRPSESAARPSSPGTVRRPTRVLRTIGSSAYRNSAISAGTSPMLPTIAIRNASSASDGTVCSTATTAEQRRRRPAASARRRCRAGRRAATASPSEPNTSSRCSPSRRPKSGAKTRSIRVGRALSGACACDGAPAAAPPCATKRLRDLGEAAAVEFDLRVERDHRRRIDAAFEAAQRRRVERGAHQQHRFVAREERAVVLEHPQAKAPDLGVGRVDVDHVDLAGRDRVVGEAVVEPGAGLDRQTRRRPSAPASHRRAAGTRATGRGAARRCAAAAGRRSCGCRAPARATRASRAHRCC